MSPRKRTVTATLIAETEATTINSQTSIEDADSRVIGGLGAEDT